MNASEKKVLEKLSAGQLNKIKASDEVIEIIVDGAREELENIEEAIAEEENQPEYLQNENVLNSLEKRAEYFRSVIKNGEKFFEKKEKAELFGEYFEEEEEE